MNSEEKSFKENLFYWQKIKKKKNGNLNFFLNGSILTGTDFILRILEK